MDQPVETSSTCRSCAGPVPPERGLCYCCASLVRQLGMPLAPVVAITPYRVGDALHRALRGYKDAPVADERHAHTAALAHLVRRWLVVQSGQVADRLGDGWDAMVAVPSSSRPAGAPVDDVLAMVPALARCPRQRLARGPEATGHLVASRRGFVLVPGGGSERMLTTEPELPHRVLVVDDSLTTGARAQSAVAALRRAGIGVAGVLVIGRVISPGAGPWQAAYWRASAGERTWARAACRLPPG